MEQKFGSVLAVAVFAVGLAISGTTASAATLTNLGGAGNDNDIFQNGLNGSPSLVKCDTGTNSNTPVTCSKWDDGKAAGNYIPAFTLTYTKVDAGYSFDWTYDATKVTGLGPNDAALFPHYVSVKQSNGYDIWELDDSERNGGSIFTTLNDISHVSFFNTGAPPVVPPVVPLPAAGWLLLAGLGGLAALRRRKA